MRKGNKYLAIIFGVAIILTYISIGFIHISIVRKMLYSQVSDTTAYSAKQIAQIVEKRINEDAEFYKGIVMVDEVTSVPCDEVSCNEALLVSRVRSVLSSELDAGNITRIGAINTELKAVVISHAAGSTSHYNLDVLPEFFSSPVHVLTFNNIVAPEDYQTEHDKGEIMYVYKLYESEYIIISRPREMLNEFFSSLPYEYEKQIYLVGYQGVENPNSNFVDGLIYYSDKAYTNPNFLDIINNENDANALNMFIQGLKSKKSTQDTYAFNGKSQLIYSEPFFGSSDYVYYIFTTPNSVINTLVKDLEVTTIVLSSVSVSLLLVFIYLIYRTLQKNLNDSPYSRLVTNRAKTYILEVKKNGNIIFKNNYFAKGVKRMKDNINDYKFIDNTSFANSIKTYEPFVIKDQTRDSKDIYIRFSVLRKFNRYELIGQNITKDLSLIESMKEIALTDSLTSLYNRKALLIDIDNILDDLNIKIKNSLLVIDVQQFKNINSLFGRDFGDSVLKEIGMHLINEVKDAGKCYRLEGNSFGVLLQNIDSYAFTVDVAKRIISMFSKSMIISGNDIKIQFKVGIFNIDKEQNIGISAEKVIQNAYLAANYVLESKRSDYYVYDQNLAMAYIKDDIMSKDIKQALYNNEFDVYYQPQYDLKQNRITGFEALIRWRNPKYANESPLKYIEMAEKNGMINEIGDFVLRKSFEFAKQLSSKDVHISINVSPVQLMQVGFINDFLKLYHDYGLTSNQICVEITETYLINNFNVVIAKLKILQENGINVHLDDFGSGYSSMTYLKDLPINAIKIDKEFTKSLDFDKYSRVIVAKLTSLAKELGLFTIIEGVETPEELTYLTRINCEIIQGYIIGPAVPKDKAEKMIDEFQLQQNVQTIKKNRKIV
jgi:diguanylate cyclase (GGDEF)-like protein